jgi:hypothetical protein
MAARLKFFSLSRPVLSPSSLILFPRERCGRIDQKITRLRLSRVSESPQRYPHRLLV